jgi:glycosyltransferase involved in cell wall biosynthesis
VTVHLLGLPHTETTSAFEFCAYTAKVRKLATMLTRAGVPVVLYGGEANEALVAEHVPLTTPAEQRAWWPHWNPQRTAFNDFDPESAPWRVWNQRVADAIVPRLQAGDVVGFTMGTAQQPLWAQVARPDVLPVEVGVGYVGVWAPYRVFESHAWRHYLAAREATDEVRLYDTVIPNFFEPEALPAGAGGGGYLLFMGRLTRRKGPHIAAEAAKRLGMPLVVAGQGALSWSRRLIVCEDGTRLEGDVRYVGVVGPAERAELMGGAVASFTPTMYLEPFGGVSVEAQMTGTPAIVANYGGLVENVVQGVTGYACSTLAEYVAAAGAAASLDRSAIRAQALATWGTDVLAPRYTEYFAKLATLYGAGWYA